MMAELAARATAEPPRVATIITSLAVGGAETALLRLVASTREDYRHLVIALVEGGPLAAEFRALGVPVLEVGMRGWFVAPKRLLDVKRRLEAFRPDIFTAHMYHAAFATVLLRRLTAPKAPLLWVFHHSLGALHSESRSTRLALRACRQLSGAPHVIIFVSGRAAEQHAAYGFPTEKSLVIPNGYDLERFHPDGEARLRLRAKWGFGENDVVVGHVAHVSPMKDHDNMIVAFALASARNAALRAVFCGAGTETLPLPDELKHRVRRLGLRSDVSQVMSACDIGCLSSAYGEAFPNVLAEFMACERPCVATNVGDTPQIISDYGCIVSPRDPAALAGAILRLAEMAPLARAALGKAARRSIAERFDISNVAAQHARLWVKCGR